MFRRFLCIFLANSVSLLRERLPKCAGYSVLAGMRVPWTSRVFGEFAEHRTTFQKVSEFSLIGFWCTGISFCLLLFRASSGRRHYKAYTALAVSFNPAFKFNNDRSVLLAVLLCSRLLRQITRLFSSNHTILPTRFVNMMSRLICLLVAAVLCAHCATTAAEVCSGKYCFCASYCLRSCNLGPIAVTYG